MEEHKFWHTQPIMKGIEELPNKGEIQKFKKEEVPTEEISLPPGFEWGLLDVNEE